jgi:hypothetical protein
MFEKQDSTLPWKNAWREYEYLDDAAFIGSGQHAIGCEVQWEASFAEGILQQGYLPSQKWARRSLSQASFAELASKPLSSKLHMLWT